MGHGHWLSTRPVRRGSGREWVELEPNHSVAQADMLPLGLGDRVRAMLLPDTSEDPADWWDLFAFCVEVPVAVAVETSDGAGGCDFDTFIHHFDPVVLTERGYGDATSESLRLGADDDDGVGLCSRLEVHLGAGCHYFGFSEFGYDDAIDEYVVSFDGVPLVGEDARCDATGAVNACPDGLECIDLDDDLDGRCVGVRVLDGAGDVRGGIDAVGSFDLYRYTTDQAVTATFRTRGVAADCPAGVAIEMTIFRVDDRRRIELAFDDDDGGCAAIEDMELEPGAYEIAVREAGDDEAIEAYVLRLEGGGALGEGAPCRVDDPAGRCDVDLYCPSGDAPSCTRHSCGDGVLQPGVERCDDGNASPVDGCDACVLTARADVTAGGIFEGSIPAEGGELLIFRLDIRSIVVVATDASVGPCDEAPDTVATVNEVTGAGVGREVGWDDDDNQTRCSYEVMVLDPGHYRIRVVEFAGAAVASFRLRVDIVESRGEGEACDRAGIDNQCEPALRCRQTAIDGIGQCIGTPLLESSDVRHALGRRSCDAARASGRAVESEGGSMKSAPCVD